MLRKCVNKRHRQGIWQRCRSIRTLKQIHATMVVRGFLSDPSAVRELVFSAAVHIPGSMHYAYKLFDQIPHPDQFVWNTIIRGAAHTPHPTRAFSIFSRMRRSGYLPDTVTFPFLLRAATNLRSPFAGAQLHAMIVTHGLLSHPFTRNALIHFHANASDLAAATALFHSPEAKQDVVAWSALIAGHARRGDLVVARRLFDEMPSNCKDLVSWNIMITAYAKHGKMVSARELFDAIPQRDLVSWNTVLAGYVQCGSNAQALKLFEEMCQAGETPDQVTMTSLLQACADSGALHVGQRLHHMLVEMSRSAGGLSTIVRNALIDMYAKCGDIEKAVEVFRGMNEKDASTWNSIIGGLAFHGHGEVSVALFKEMLSTEVQPDEITFVGVLAACSHGGMVEKGKLYFSMMRREYGLEPNIKHYGCMVDMLGRAGFLEEAFSFIEDMEIEPNPIVWRTLLGACKIHGNVELGKRANEKLQKLAQDASGNYVLLSNIYASMGEWGGVEKMRKLMDYRGVVKEAGQTLLESDGKQFMHILQQEINVCKENNDKSSSQQLNNHKSL